MGTLGSLFASWRVLMTNHFGLDSKHRRPFKTTTLFFPTHRHTTTASDTQHQSGHFLQATSPIKTFLTFQHGRRQSAAAAERSPLPPLLRFVFPTRPSGLNRSRNGRQTQANSRIIPTCASSCMRGTHRAEAAVSRLWLQGFVMQCMATFYTERRGGGHGFFFSEDVGAGAGGFWNWRGPELTVWRIPAQRRNWQWTRFA